LTISGGHRNYQTRYGLKFNVTIHQGAYAMDSIFKREDGSRYNKRISGTRIKHLMGEVSVKIYDKFGIVLRKNSPMPGRTYTVSLTAKY
jgi:hypothetical protein